MGKPSNRLSREVRKQPGWEVKYLEYVDPRGVKKHTALWLPMDNPHERPAPRARRVAYPRSQNKFVRWK